MELLAALLVAILHLIFETGSSGSLNALLCDATVVNTGKFGGVIKLIETELEPIACLSTPFE